MIARALIAIALFATPAIALADGTLFMTPERGSYHVGDTLELDIRMNTGGATVNAAEAELSYDPHSLIVQSITTDGSVLSAWPTAPSYDNDEGIVNFSGTTGAPYSGDSGELVHVTFVVKGVLKGDVHITSGALLSLQGQSTNILSTMRGALFTLLPHVAEPSAGTDTSLSTDATPQVKGAAIVVPTITPLDTVLRAGDRIALSGTAAADSHVSVFYAYENETPANVSVAVAADGSFTYVVPEKSRAGTYHAWAVAKGDGGETFNSDTVDIRVQNDLTAALGSLGNSPYAFGSAIALAFIAAILCVALMRRR